MAFWGLGVQVPSGPSNRFWWCLLDEIRTHFEKNPQNPLDFAQNKFALISVYSIENLIIFINMAKKIYGCTHLIVRDGKIVNVITHLSYLPKNGVVHLKGDKLYTYKEFKKSHIHDHDELIPKKPQIIISDY